MKCVEGFPLKLLWNRDADYPHRRIKNLLPGEADTLIVDLGAAQFNFEVAWRRKGRHGTEWAGSVRGRGPPGRGYRELLGIGVSGLSRGADFFLGARGEVPFL